MERSEASDLAGAGLARWLCKIVIIPNSSNNTQYTIPSLFIRTEPDLHSIQGKGIDRIPLFTRAIVQRLL